MPKSWADLLKPEYKGEIVTAHPGSSGTFIHNLCIELLISIKGEKMEWLICKTK